MFRLRSSSTNARSEPANRSTTNTTPSNVSNMSLLGSSSNARNRAVDNDYTEHPGQRLRPGSAPASSSALSFSARDAERHREERHHRHHREHRSSRHHRSRRHCQPHPLPGSVARITTSSLPSHLVSRDLRFTDGDRFAPVVPARPFTIGHSHPRRQLSGDDILHRSRPAPPLPSSNDSSTPPRNLNIPPPRPPPPPPDVAARLGVEVKPRSNKVDAITQTISTGPVQTVQPSPTDNTRSNDIKARVVVAQPKAQSKKTSKSTKTSTDDLLKKSLVVDLKSNKSTKTSVSTENSTLKKDLVRTSSTGSHKDDERQLLRGNPDGNGNKLEEVCPRCKNCPRCQGSTNDDADVQRSSRSCFMCNRRSVCSAQDCIEVATCVYCLKGGLYHCTNYEENEELVDKPFSCRAPNCCLRWSALAVLSIFLPCLLCYPVAVGCTRACKACSPKKGCKCKDSYR